MSSSIEEEAEQLYPLHQCCGSCRFAEPAADEGKFLCLRRSPQDTDDEQEAVWPVVECSWWCGEWRFAKDGSRGLTQKQYAKQERLRKEYIRDMTGDEQADGKPAPSTEEA